MNMKKLSLSVVWYQISMHALPNLVRDVCPDVGQPVALDIRVKIVLLALTYFNSSLIEHISV